MLAGGLAISACASQEAAESAKVREKLARLGLELISENEALIPAELAGHFVPVRVISGFVRPALEPHPAGYLMVGVNRRPGANADAILCALTQWSPGETLVLTIRRNPYLQGVGGEPGWWEADVKLRLPNASGRSSPAS